MARKSRYPHISSLLLGLGIVLLAGRLLLKEASLLEFFGALPIFLNVTVMAITIMAVVVLFLSKVSLAVKKHFKLGLWILFILYLGDFLIMPLINSVVSVRGLDRIPERSHFLDSVIFIFLKHWPDFLKGLGVTLMLSLIGTVIGLGLGVILVYFRTLTIHEQDGEVKVFLKKFMLGAVKIYVNIFRGTPMMVQAVIIYYAAPAAIASLFRIPQAEIDAIFTLFIAGLVVVSLNTAAYLTEVLRGGIEAVDKGQAEAARSLGMSHRKAMLYVVFPQGIKNALPAICNEFLINIKDTSVLNVIGVAELFFMAQDVKFIYYRSYEPFIIAGLIYLVVTLSISKIILLFEKKMNLETKELPSCN